MPGKRPRQPSDADNPTANHCSIGSTTPQHKSRRLQDEHRSKAKMVQGEGQSEGSQSTPRKSVGRDEVEEVKATPTPNIPARQHQTFRQRLGDAIQGRDYFDLQRIAAEDQIGCTERSGDINEVIPQEWDIAAGVIMNFASELAERVTGNWDGLEPGLREELLRWTPQAHDFLGDPDRAGFLYAARIWHTLDEQLLSASAETSRDCLGPEWTRFAQMKDALKATGHDKPWKQGDKEAAYHMWKWYTALMTHYSLRSFPVDRIIRVIASRVIRDLAPLVGVGTDEAEAWTPEVENFCYPVALAARSMALTHSKIWVAWKPENYTRGQSGFLVSSATDEGLNVMMKPWEWIPWRPLHDPNSLNGKKVHLVVSPALVGSFLFTGDLTHHYMVPMTVIVDGHLHPGGSSGEAGLEVANETQPSHGSAGSPALGSTARVVEPPSTALDESERSPRSPAPAAATSSTTDRCPDGVV